MKNNNIPIIEDGFNEELLYSSSHIFPICSLDNLNNGVIYIVSKRVLSASSIFSYFSEFGLVECGIVAPLLLVTFILIYIITIHVILP